MISLVRVDNRLLHGQILETWIPKLGIHEVVVADDAAAASDLARAAMTLCVPPDLPARILAVKDVPWGALAESKAPVLVLVRDVASLVAARAAGLRPEIAPKVNLGNVHFGPGRRPVTPSVFLSEPELVTLRRAAAHLPRIDAIGGSSAGVYVDSQPRIASLFRGIPKDRYGEVREMGAGKRDREQPYLKPGSISEGVRELRTWKRMPDCCPT